jgi:4'-phosphopantetheinyl transferase
MLAPDVHIWYQDTRSIDEQALEFADDVLSQDERARRDRLRFREDRRDFATAHSLLRRSLSKHLPDRHPADWRFDRNAFGKPYLSGGDTPAPAIEFNLSHTTGIVACAISSAHVGVDVERVRPNMDYEAIARSSYSREELRMLQALPVNARVARVIELWTLKEAFLKGIGKGLSGPLDSIWFELEPRADIRFHAPAEVAVGAWKFALFAPQMDVTMAVAVESPEQPRWFLQGSELLTCQPPR